MGICLCLILKIINSPRGEIQHYHTHTHTHIERVKGQGHSLCWSLGVLSREDALLCVNNDLANHEATLLLKVTTLGQQPEVHITLGLCKQLR